MEIESEKLSTESEKLSMLEFMRRIAEREGLCDVSEMKGGKCQFPHCNCIKRCLSGPIMPEGIDWDFVTLEDVRTGV